MVFVLRDYCPIVFHRFVTAALLSIEKFCCGISSNRAAQPVLHNNPTGPIKVRNHSLPFRHLQAQYFSIESGKTSYPIHLPGIFAIHHFQPNRSDTLSITLSSEVRTSELKSKVEAQQISPES